MLLRDRDEDLIVGIRTNDVAMCEALRLQLRHAVVTDVDASPNISVKVGQRRGSVRDTHLVYRRGFFVKRTLSFDEAVASALAQLHTLRQPPPGTLALLGRALVRDGEAAFVADAFTMILDVHHRAVARAGYTMTGHSPVLVRPEQAVALVPDLTDPLDPTYTEIPLTAIVALAPNEPGASAATRLSHITPLAVGHGLPATATALRGLLSLTRQRRVVRLAGMDASTLLEALTER